MELKYNEFIELLNQHKISDVTFSVAGYAHYNYCKITISKEKPKESEFYLIKIVLTKDLSEMVSFYNVFDENYKLFDLKRKGKYTLKQIWDRIQINTLEMQQIKHEGGSNEHLSTVEAAIAVSVTGAQIAAAGAAAAIGLGIMFAQLPRNGGPSNGTLSNDSSIGHYDENGNLTERIDISGRPHYIKELGGYYLPHTHHRFGWKIKNG